MLLHGNHLVHPQICNMENLTNEFFEKLKAAHPDATERFFDFLNYYVEDTNFEPLTRLGFYAMPLDYQLGIINRFSSNLLSGESFDIWSSKERIENLFKLVEDELEYVVNDNIEHLEITDLSGKVALSVPFLQFKINDEQQFAAIAIDFDKHKCELGDETIDVVRRGKLSEQGSVFASQIKNSLKSYGWDYKKYPNPEIVIIQKKKGRIITL